MHSALGTVDSLQPSQDWSDGLISALTPSNPATLGTSQPNQRDGLDFST